MLLKHYRDREEYLLVMFKGQSHPISWRGDQTNKYHKC